MFDFDSLSFILEANFNSKINQSCDLKDKVFYERTNRPTMKVFSGDIFYPSVISNIKKGEQFQNFFKTIDCNWAMLGWSIF